MTGTTSSILERHLAQMALHNLGSSSLFTASPSSSGVSRRGQHDRSDILSSFSRQLSSLRERLRRGDAQVREDLRDVSCPEPVLVDYPSEAPSAHISKLPPEILAIIFKEVRDAAFPTRPEYSDYDLTRCLSWLSITGVCFMWRAVALYDPLLWTTVPLEAHQEIVLLHFNLSNGQPLRIFASFESLLDHRSAVRDNAWRIVSFIQFGESPMRERVWEKDLLYHALSVRNNAVMPILEEVRVSGGDLYDGNDEYCLLRPDSALVHAPNLRDLSTCGSWPLLLGSLRIPQLRRLSLQGAIAKLGTWSHESLLLCLQANPHLEEIDVDGLCEKPPRYRPGDWDHALATFPHVELRRLRRLRLTGGYEGILIALRFMTFDPRCTLVELNVAKELRNWDVRCDPSRSILAQGLGSHNDCNFSWLRVDRTSIQAGFDDDGQTPRVIIRPIGVKPLPPDALQRNDAGLRGVHLDALTPAAYMTVALKLSGVRTFSFGPHHGTVWGKTLHKFYGWCTQVEVVEVTTTDMLALCRTLLMPLDAPFGPVFLPSLRRVKVFDWYNMPLSGEATQSRAAGAIRGNVSIELVWRKGAEPSLGPRTVALFLDDFNVSS